MKQKSKTMVRVNTRIRPEQLVFVKAEAKKNNVTEGEMFRTIVEFYMKQPK